MGCGVVNRDPRAENPIQRHENLAEDEKIMFDKDINEEVNRISLKGKRKGNDKPKAEEEKVGLFVVEKPGEGDQMLAIKPWLGAMKPPTKLPSMNKNPPSISLELEHVYGYRCFDTRQNLYYTRNPDEIVYMAAAVGIVLNKRHNTQKFFGGGPASSNKGHNDDITSLAIHPNNDIIATGEVGKNPKICV